MADTSKQEIKLFYCYAREDQPLRDELEKHLAWLKHRYKLTNWSDREILPGEEWEKAIDKHLHTAHLILLLISPDFMASDYCFSNMMQHALARHKTGTCCVVPILIRPTYWKDAPFSSLRLLPTGAKAITLWPDRDEAFEHVVTEISRTVEDLLLSLKTKEDWFEEGNALRNLEHYEEALTTFEQAIRLDPNYAIAYRGKGLALRKLKRYEEALTAYEQAIRLDSNNAYAYHGKGVTLSELKRDEEALVAFEQAIRLDPNYAIAYQGKGVTLSKLKRDEEALTIYEQAIRLDPNNATAYYYKGLALRNLERYEEARQAFEKAAQLERNQL